MIYHQDHTFAILAYKNSEFLEACVVSLLQQQAQSRIIIATSTPTASIDTIAKRYSIPVHVNPRQEGIASDWSFAYQCCNTTYVTLAHQDDIYLPDYTKSCLSDRKSADNSLILFTDYMEQKNDSLNAYGPLLLVKRAILSPFFIFRKSIASKSLKKLMLSFGSPVCCPSVMYNKKRIGDLNFNPAFSINMDWEMWAQLAGQAGSFTYINRRLVIHRLHKESATTKGLRSRDRQNEDITLFRYFWPPIISAFIIRLYSLSYRLNT